VEAVGEYDPETQSTLRRQSVIIEGLTYAVLSRVK